MNFVVWLVFRAGLMIALAGAPWSTAAAKSPQHYGAKADGTTLDTAALQHAIDDAHAAGGGIVRIEPGLYCTGTLELRSGVTLHLEPGAVLLGSPKIADYRRGHWPALIKARGQEHIAITGGGTIDGQGKLVAQDTIRIFEAGSFLDFFPGLKPGEKVLNDTGSGTGPSLDPFQMQRDGTLGHRVAPRSREDAATWRVDEFVRPQLLEFWDCRDVRVSGVTLKNAANWVQTYRDCDHVVIAGIHVDSTTYWNNDGIDLVNSRQVRIENCDINAADDGICLKSEPAPEDRWCEDIMIARCRIRSSASALKFGTASHQGFRHVRVEDLEIHDTYRSAIALEAVDGGTIEDVKIFRVRARNTGNAFFLRIGQRNATKPPGFLRNIELSDIDAQIPSGRPDEGYAHQGPPLELATNLIPSSLVGLPDRPVENVVLRNITITYGGGGRRDRAEVPLSKLDSIPEKRSDYPEFSMFGELPAWGLYLRNVDGVKIENMTLRLASADFRAAVVADRVCDLALKEVNILSAGEEPAVVLKEVSGEVFDQVKWPVEAREKIRRLPATAPRR